MLNVNWPPPYSIKKHPRAKRVKLKVSSQKGLELILPPRFNPKHIPAILEEHKTWIQKQMNQVVVLIQDQQTLPTTIMLTAIQQQWHIHYMKTKAKTVKLMERPDHELVLLGNVDNNANCRKLLSAWIRDQANIHLVSWLHSMSRKTKLSFESVNIRSQHGRWGSCSTQKSINLNDRLLFLPAAWVNYIIIHELCHTAHMNHSQQFWNLVEHLDPDYKLHIKALRDTKAYIPLWLV